jgi:hypothetical protein
MVKRFYSKKEASKSLFKPVKKFRLMENSSLLIRRKFKKMFKKWLKKDIEL